MRKLRRIDQAEEYRQETWKIVLCCIAMIAALAVAAVSVYNYRLSVQEKSTLLNDVKTTRAQKDEVIANNNILKSEYTHLMAKVKDAKDDVKSIDKIPNRIKKIDELNRDISKLETQLADLDSEIEALRAQLPPGTVVEIDE